MQQMIITYLVLSNYNGIRILVFFMILMGPKDNDQIRKFITYIKNEPVLWQISILYLM